MLKGRMKSLRLYLISSATRTTALLTIKPCCFSSCKIAHETALLVYLLLQMVLFFFRRDLRDFVENGSYSACANLRAPERDLFLPFVTAAIAAYRVVSEKGGRSWWARKANEILRS